MVAKKETVTSLKRDVVRLTEELEKVKKEKNDTLSTKDMYYRNWQESQAEINAVHDLLDVLPGAIEKEMKTGYGSHKLMTRLASFLAQRNVT